MSDFSEGKKSYLGIKGEEKTTRSKFPWSKRKIERVNVARWLHVTALGPDPVPLDSSPDTFQLYTSAKFLRLTMAQFRQM